MSDDRPKVGVVDIGTNSMRLLVTDGLHEDGRWVEVTGLGIGVGTRGDLAADAIQRTLDVFDRFRKTMDEFAVERRMAIATSASREAENRDQFFDMAETALGVRPCLISGEREARYAFSGATMDMRSTSDVLVTDIGGGSTEFVSKDAARSVDVGTLRLTGHLLPDIPPNPDQLARAVAAITGQLADIDWRDDFTHLGVAGTWTSIAAIARQLSGDSDQSVHGFTLTNEHLHEVLDWLIPLTIMETAAIPGLDPKRAPVILAGTIIATKVVETLGVSETTTSEVDSLDGVALELLALL